MPVSILISQKCFVLFTGSITLNESTFENRISDFDIFISGFLPFPASMTWNRMSPLSDTMLKGSSA